MDKSFFICTKGVLISNCQLTNLPNYQILSRNQAAGNCNEYKTPVIVCTDDLIGFPAIVPGARHARSWRGRQAQLCAREHRGSQSIRQQPGHPRPGGAPGEQLRWRPCELLVS